MACCRRDLSWLLASLAIKLDRLYTRSQECTAATAVESRTLCQKLAALEGEKTGAMTAEEIRSAIAAQMAKQAKAESAMDRTDLAEVVSVADAGTQGLANMLGWTLEDTRRRLAWFFAMLIEVGGGLGGWLLTGGHLPTWRRTERNDPPPSNGSEQPITPDPSDNPALGSAVAQWASKFLAKRKGTFTPAKEAWQAFNAWAAIHGHEQLNQTAFGKEMTDVKVVRKKRGGNTVYLDLALLPAKPLLRIVR